MSGKGKASARDRDKAKNHKGGHRTFTDSRTAAGAFVTKKVFVLFFLFLRKYLNFLDDSHPTSFFSFVFNYFVSFFFLIAR